MWRKGWVLVTRWPANTALPTSPGSAVPGQWLGPLSMLRIVMPWKTGWTRPILGISIEPICSTGSGAYSFFGGATGAGGGAVVVTGCSVDAGRGAVVDVVVGAATRSGVSAI